MGKIKQLDSLKRKLTTDDNEPVAKGNPLPIQDIDAAGRVGMNTVFGDRITGRRVPTVSSQFYYPLASDRANFEMINGGSFTIDESLLKVRTDAQVNSTANIQGNFFLRYIPGHEAYCFFTGVYNIPSANSHQRIGLFDANDGFYIGYDGLDFVIAKRRGGIVEKKVIDITKVFPDGSFDPKFGSVYKISFGYLGFATIHYEVMTQTGGWVSLGEFGYPNTSTVTHVLTTYLPVRAELFNGTDGQAMELRSGSISTGIVDGAGTDPGARRFSQTIPEVTTGTKVLLVLRSKATYGGKENRVNAILTLLSASIEGNKNASFKLIKNPTIASGTFADVNTLDSMMEYSTDATITPSTGTEVLPFSLAKVDKLFEKIKELTINIRPNESLAVEMTLTTGTTITNLGLRWEELF